MPAHNWMSTINNDLRLSEITMPGSHDAGIHAGVTERRGLAPARFAITQNVGIREQCNRGSRFFDIRIEAGAGRTYHGAAIIGAFGQSLDDILLDVRAFLLANPQEFVILRFSKTQGNLDAIINQVQALLGPGPAQIDLLFSVNTNIASQPIRNLRRRAICVFEETHPAIIPTDGLHRFVRYAPPLPPSGLIACGKFSESTRLREVVNGQVTKIDEHADHHRNNHLFVLYWTQTFKITKPWKQTFAMDISRFSSKARNLDKERQKRRVTGGAQHNMDYLKWLVCTGRDLRAGQQKTTVVVTTHADRLRIMPNVIMYDFVNADMSNEIVSLNDPALRGHVIDYDGMAEMFQ
jgi:hypothetical protein